MARAIILGIKDASSEEFETLSTQHMIKFMPEIDAKTMGGNMRLGLRPTIFQKDSEWSKMRKLYGSASSINERHRHRYEVNPEHVDKLAAAGLPFIGKDDKGERMEIIELKNHPFFVGVQFHPEYLSRVLRPSPPYLGFVAASAGMLDEITSPMAAKGENGHAVVNGEGHDIVKGMNGVMI
ncbi:CTP synthase ura7 [Elasticomyces elasticus]|nr:CTP synthase ura7 [Elasticomyces elasticus]